jgi:16S rRNA (uracil1498-N3)-methyltransferase
MSVPYFFMENLSDQSRELELDETNSRHALQVLRMKRGDQVHVTNGRGLLVLAEITGDYKRKCLLQPLSFRYVNADSVSFTIGISLLKNASRMEWLLEKATEIGINRIVPLFCERTERTHFRYDRMRSILISALLQSQQTWLPELLEPMPLNDWLEQQQPSTTHKWIAHCEDNFPDKLHLRALIKQGESGIVLIGPEGDFSPEEISFAIAKGYTGVSLGETRLRTETAGLMAACLMKGLGDNK